MKNPIKNADTEHFAQNVARAIRTENTKEYEQLMKSEESPLNRMVRWELLAFRDRVCYLVTESLNGGDS